MSKNHELSLHCIRLRSYRNLPLSRSDVDLLERIDMSACIVCKGKGEYRADLRASLTFCDTHYRHIKKAEELSQVVPSLYTKERTCVDSDI